MKFNLVLASFTALAFFYYGLSCLFSKKMVEEFNRFGLSNQQRMITGVLQLLGSIGILIGFKFPLLGMVGTVGLSALMLLGFAVRVKIKDGIEESLPSFVFMIINGYLFYGFYLVNYIR
ncbi:DoxX family protein [Ekhidna sp.]|uniref:DoxX family protein n=1 Tax=Ekhidna sp. TaxID=2608089 RepID=UPI003C7D02AC